ncbi:hypothetical protein SCHPADRAFT_482319 [Schizopora paradoxa]|uniref:Uncharacterized protein n=1 Tax=Schizopora paradoxa TaxID=27342 RepID=A0A0H2RH36_9AGAM|nr:hypothetical protein SCHPADRAFT_482319 [Schizopora paradoxa]
MPFRRPIHFVVVAIFFESSVHSVAWNRLRSASSTCALVVSFMRTWKAQKSESAVWAFGMVISGMLCQTFMLKAAVSDESWFKDALVALSTNGVLPSRPENTPRLASIVFGCVLDCAELENMFCGQTMNASIPLEDMIRRRDIVYDERLLAPSVCRNSRAPLAQALLRDFIRPNRSTLSSMTKGTFIGFSRATRSSTCNTLSSNSVR